jgi:hypothetical protein
MLQELITSQSAWRRTLAAGVRAASAELPTVVHPRAPRAEGYRRARSGQRGVQGILQTAYPQPVPETLRVVSDRLVVLAYAGFECLPRGDRGGLTLSSTMNSTSRGRL